MADTTASAMPAGVTDPNYKPLPGRLGNLTPAQQEALDQLKKELEAEGTFVPERMDDAMLLRFLRARKFDVVKAKAMLLEAEKWRKDFGVEDIMKNFQFTEREQVMNYYPQYYHKTDKDGRPLYIQQVGKLDVAALYKITTKERMLQQLVYEYEKFLQDRIPACSKAVGHPIETTCSILDLKNVSLSSYYKVSDFISEASAIGQNRYPETMGKFYIINAPWGFSTIWAIVRGWLDAVTVEKIKMLSGSELNKLLEQIPAENLPKEFGGKCECKGGCTLSNAGPWNPSAE